MPTEGEPPVQPVQPAEPDDGTLVGLIRSLLASQDRRGDALHQAVADALTRGGHQGNSAANSFKRLNPPFFDGSEDAIAANAWLQDTVVILEAARTPENEKVAVVCLQLLDLVRSWWAAQVVGLVAPIA